MFDIGVIGMTLVPVMFLYLTVERFFEYYKYDNFKSWNAGSGIVLIYLVIMLYLLILSIKSFMDKVKNKDFKKNAYEETIYSATYIFLVTYFLSPALIYWSVPIIHYIK
jgi:hypothetical protein